MSVWVQALPSLHAVPSAAGVTVQVEVPLHVLVPHASFVQVIEVPAQEPPGWQTSLYVQRLLSLQETPVPLTVAAVVAPVDAQPLTVTVTVYVPPAAPVAFGIDGFCALEVNPFGPVQLYVAPATVDALRFRVAPAQIGPLFDAPGADGAALTVRIADADVTDCPSGFVIVIVFVPGVAAIVFNDSVACNTRLVDGLAGMTMLVAGYGLTVTPPVTDAAMWFA